jgi:flagellar assembly protein FliH
VGEQAVQALSLRALESNRDFAGGAGLETVTVAALVQARDEARRIRAAAIQEAENLKQKAFADAFQQGREEGLAAAREQMAAFIAEARQMLASAEKIRREIIKSAEPQVLELALLMAETLLNAKLATDRKAILGVVTAALAQVAGEEAVVVRVNPDDYAVCRDHRDSLPGFLADDAGLKFIFDESIPRGSCRVQSKNGQVESMLSERFEILKRALLGEAENAGAYTVS